MPGNRRRHANVVPLASIVMWITICIFAGAAGLFYVSMKNELHSGAEEVKRLERDAEQIAMRTTVVKGEIEKLSSLDALKRRYESDKNHLGGLVDIPPDRVVWVDRPLPVPAADPGELQQTSNKR